MFTDSGICPWSLDLPNGLVGGLLFEYTLGAIFIFGKADRTLLLRLGSVLASAPSRSRGYHSLRVSVVTIRYEQELLLERNSESKFIQNIESEGERKVKTLVHPYKR